MQDLPLLPPNCPIQLFPQTATFKLSQVEPFLHIPEIQLTSGMSPAHSFIHSLSKDVNILSGVDRSRNRGRSFMRLILATPTRAAQTPTWEF